MPERYALVEHSSAINSIIRNTFQTTQRIKFTAFDVSTKYIIFGANTGGIYIFTREPCQFLKLIPSTHGPTNLLKLSPNQENLAISVSTGLMIVLENCFSPHFEQQVFTEHEGQTVTAMKWQGNDLYCGDSMGRVSVVTFKNFLAKAIFQIPVATLMQLDSQIIQIDVHLKFLLVSTQTRTLLCDTECERYRQIGKKIRDGPFGACFLNAGNLIETSNLNRNWGAFTTVSDSEQFSHFLNDENVKIYCARPGMRLWQADFQANVMVTHQFRSSLPQKHSDIIQWNDYDELKIKTFEGSDIGENFNFGRIFSALDKFILTYKDDGFYIFDPTSSTILHWSTHISNIKDIKIVDSFLYIWHNELEVSVVSLSTVEGLILRSLVKKRYNLCGELCVKFFDEVESLLSTSRNIHLISALQTKLKNSEVLSTLSPIFQRLKESAKTLSLEKLKNGIVTVNALPMLPESVQNFQTDEQDKKTIKDPMEESISILLEQYKIYKINKTIETTDFMNFMKTLDSQRLYQLIMKFRNETKEDCDLWCKEIFLKNLNSVDIPSNILQYACEAFLEVNRRENLRCKCDFPLPQCHEIVPKYFEIGCQLMEKSNSYDLFLKNVPSMYNYLLKEIDPKDVALKISLIIQFSDAKIIEYHSEKMTYDLWDESIRLLAKLKSGQCLNCGSKIDATNSFSWTNFGVLMVESIKPTNAIKLLKRYSSLLPKGELDQFFYQYCILIAAVDVKNPTLKETLSNVNVKKQFECSVGGYLRRKYLHGACYDPPSNKSLENCDHCHLPFKIPILEDEEKLPCGHKYHKACFVYNEKRCKVCEQIV